MKQSKNYDTIWGKAMGYGVPEHLAHALARYMAYGHQPGSYIMAIVDGDLFEAVNHGDDEAIAAMGAIVKTLVMGS